VSSPDPDDPARTGAERRDILGDAVGVAVASGAYAVSFGAISVAAGLTIGQTVVLSVFMFTGASQFALVGVIAGGGNALAGAATAVLLGARNAIYGLRLAPLLELRGWRKLAGAQLVIDESTAMSMGRSSPALSRFGFYATGIALFLCWNVGTAAGAVGASFVGDPRALGLDAAVPAAFLALLAPQLRRREPRAIALLAALVAVATTPLLPPGLPVLVSAAVAALAIVLIGRRGGSDQAIGPDRADENRADQNRAHRNPADRNPADQNPADQNPAEQNPEQP
jgi:predicted branched-subunit amino acid permease